MKRSGRLPVATGALSGGVRRAAGAAIVAALLPAAALAGALEDCSARVAAAGAGERGRLLTACLNAAKRAATDEMLEAFLGTDRALAEFGGRGAPQALKQSQRDFERYLQSHCVVAQQAAPDSAAIAQAQLGCETDLLRERAAQLNRLAPAEAPAPAPRPPGAAGTAKD